MNSGTAALSLAIELSIAAREAADTPEVILPAYGCPDLVAAVVFQGATPVLVDLDGEQPNLSLSAIVRAMSSKTVAIVAVDFLGLAENLAGIKTLIAETDIRIIEDSAQGFPPASSGSGIADYVVLSFGRGKPINLMGGGALLIRHDHRDDAAPILNRLPQESVSLDSKWRLRRFLFNTLLSRPFYGLLLRFPFLGLGKTEYAPLGTICRVNLPTQMLEAGIRYHRQRQYLEDYLSKALTTLETRGWSGPRPLALNSEGAGPTNKVLPRLLRFPLLAPSVELRDQAVSELNAAGIGANTFYGRPLPAISGLERVLSSSVQDFPCASDFSRRLITLPLHEDVTSADIDRMADVLEQLTSRTS
ncbi:DegT/DnrJ/EryC1/StrS family aminotransferase [Marinobacter fonticola]|uniref:DegT/DnrJ/EryC1/StrS family aminotransferase n=1 Tax=Marinobacter fonticola TaxID=2603215 RepID=UPI00143DA4EA|nr:DegT/DnrJ/EryC1/StrS family aminotransferase [Marinobacter fonticola]